MMTDNEIIAVVQAHKEGKKIEARGKPGEGNEEWSECKFPNWDFYRGEFRVAPEPRKPREWSIVINKQGEVLAQAIYPMGYEIIRVREMIQ